jgi:hypothetical protein
MAFLKTLGAIAGASAMLVAIGCQPASSSDSTDGSHSGADHHHEHADKAASAYAKPGFYGEIVEGRLWVFENGSEGLEEYKAHGEPAKNATKIGVGPLGMTVKSVDLATIEKYLVSIPGYYTEVVDGRIWVFEAGSEDLAEYKKVGEPAKNVTKIGVGPLGMTVKGGDLDTVNAYLDAVESAKVAKPGFYTEVIDGRVWAFPIGSEDLVGFHEHGEPAKNATLIGVGPFGMTVKSGSRADALAYVVSAPGFHTELVDERIWVFESGSEDLAEFKAVGEPAKNATKISAGPLGMTVKSGDIAVIDAYIDAPK